MSIWDGVDRDKFYRDVDTLCKKDKFQDTQDISERLLPHLLTNPEDDSAYLSAILERQLADDLAFLASWTTYPRHVSAAAVQQKTDPNRLCLSVAANQGIDDSVQSMFETISRHLERRARRELSREDTMDLCRDVVVPVHRDRIFGRLGSRKASGQHQSQVNLLERLAKLLKRLAWSSGPQSRIIADQLIRLKNAIEAADSAVGRSTDEYAALKDILQLAFTLVSGKESLVVRIRRLGITTISDRSREIRDLRALANYCRIFSDLAKISSRLRTWLGSIQFDAIDPYTPKRWHGQRLYVHAELQLLAHFELHPTSRPRFIGASKKPCYLCYCFIRAHASYSICGSHGEVYLQWMVPEDDAFNAEIRAKLTAAIQRTSNDITRATKLIKKPINSHFYMNPLQTVSKLLINRSQSSVSTVATVVSKGSNSTYNALVAVAVPADEGTQATATKPTLSTDNVTEAVSALSTSETKNDQTSPVDPESIASDQSDADECVFSSQHPAEFCSDDLTLLIELEKSCSEGAESKAPINETQTALCRIKRASGFTTSDENLVSMERLVAGEITLEKEDLSDSVEFILNARTRSYAVQLYWLRLGEVESTQRVRQSAKGSLVLDQNRVERCNKMGEARQIDSAPTNLLE